MILSSPQINASVCASIARSIFSILTPADVMRIESNLSAFHTGFGGASFDDGWLYPEDNPWGPDNHERRLDH